MKFIVRAVLMAFAMLATPLVATAQPLSYDGLKGMITGMGYTPKEVGTTAPKMEILVVTDSFNVPAGLEITPSGRYIWITANLGESKIDSDRAMQIFQRAKEWQPTQFWITSSNTLTIGLTINNAAVTPEMLKFALDKLATDVGKTADIWQVK